MKKNCSYIGNILFFNIEQGPNGVPVQGPLQTQSLDIPKKRILKLAYAQLLASLIAMTTQVKGNKYHY